MTPSNTLQTSDSYTRQSDEILAHFNHQNEKQRRASRRDFGRRVVQWLCLSLTLCLIAAALLFSSLHRTMGVLTGALNNTGPTAAGAVVRKSGVFYARAGQTLHVQYDTNTSTNRTRFVVMKNMPSQTLDSREVSSGQNSFDISIPVNGFYDLSVDDTAMMGDRADAKYAWNYQVSWQLMN